MAAERCSRSCLGECSKQVNGSYRALSLEQTVVFYNVESQQLSQRLDGLTTACSATGEYFGDSDISEALGDRCCLIVSDSVQFTIEVVAMPKDSACCLLYTSPSPRDKRQSRMPSSA